jgi:hypothetical protein
MASTTIIIIDDTGNRWCGDNRWRKFANYGSYRECVKTYKTVGSAKITAKRHKARIVAIPSNDEVRRSIEAQGKVIEYRDSPDRPGYEIVSHTKLDEFVVEDYRN